MKNGLIRVTLIVFATMTAVSLAEPPDEKPGVPPYEVTETEIKLPGVTISRKTNEIRVEAVCSLESGILEYVVCRPDTFEHESIFTTTAKPELVHAALLLTGLEPNPQKHGLAELWYEKALKKESSRVNIEVEWQEGETVKRVTLASLLRSRDLEATQEAGEAEPDKAGKPAEVQNAWVFTGSFIGQNPENGEPFYAANRSGILVGIWPNPTTVIQYGLAEGNPYEGQDLGMEIHEDRVPKKGTKVQLIFSKLPSEEENSKGKPRNKKSVEE